MDSRIGYPNEHLASNREWEELKSPIFATGVGLVLRGFEDQSITKASEEVKGYSKADRGAFFQKLLSKAKDMFEAEDE